MIQAVSNINTIPYFSKLKVQKGNNNNTLTQSNFSSFDKTLAAQNKAFINFKKYQGDEQPLKKLLWHLTGRNEVYEDNWTKEHFYHAGNKRWVNAYPNELLKRTPEQAIQSICTIAKPNIGLPKIPGHIPSPNYGDKWGRHANYIEINPRLVAKYENGKVSEGLFGVMKLLPGIPPSPKSFANCIILSQLYPTHWGDGHNDGESLYHMKINDGISKNLLSVGLEHKMGADEQVKAFNDAAHLLGFKTGIRMPISSGQILVNDKPFNWNDHIEDYIKACTDTVDYGFDAIYFDSAKHIIDMDGYLGEGAVPTKEQMRHITHAIRKNTGRDDLSFVGEKCNDNPIYKEMGFTAGTDWGKADDRRHVIHETEKQRDSREYAAGPEVSNDNDDGSLSYEKKLNRIKSCLFGYDHINNKLPTFMQMDDIFPLGYGLDTHSTMMESKQLKSFDSWTECERHWDGIFKLNESARRYTREVYHEFKEVMHR